MRIKMTAFVAVCLLAMTWATPTWTAPAALPQQTYEVQPGDNLWKLSSEYLKDPLKWGQVLGANPYLKHPGRVFNRGDNIIVLIKPGETLAGLKDIGITTEPLPIEALRVPDDAGANRTVAPENRNEDLFYRQLSFWLKPGAVIGTILVGTVVVYLSRRKRSPRLPAAQQGLPIVPGGIQPHETAKIENRFERIAERRLGTIDPMVDIGGNRPQRVGPIERGFLSGPGIVQYFDQPKERVLDNEPAYRARFRFHSGAEEDLFFLQACANDVIFYGARYTGFTFTPERQITGTPAPRSVVAEKPAAIEQQPATVTKSADQPTMPEPTVPLVPKMITITIGQTQITLPEGSGITLENGTIHLVLGNACSVAITQVAAVATASQNSHRDPAAATVTTK